MPRIFPGTGATSITGSVGTLEQVTTNGSSTTKSLVFVPSATQSLLAANAILANATTVRVQGSGGSVILTSIPTIADGSDGQFLIILGASDTNLVTIQDSANLAGSNLQLSGGNDFTMGQGDTITLMFDTNAADWVEISRSGN